MDDLLTKHRILVSIEGASGSGKSTLAHSLDGEEGVCRIEPLRPEFHAFRNAVEELPMTTRLHFWLAIYYAAAGEIASVLEAGCHAVVDSYFVRTLACHGALGVSPLPEIDWSAAARPDLTILLHVSENVRLERIRERDGDAFKSAWHALVEAHAREADELLAALTGSDDRVVTIDTTQMSTRDVHEAALAVIQNTMPRPRPTESPSNAAG